MLKNENGERRFIFVIIISLLWVLEQQAEEGRVGERFRIPAEKGGSVRRFLVVDEEKEIHPILNILGRIKKFDDFVI